MYLAKYSQQTKNRRKLKGIYDKPTANIMLNGERLNVFLQRLEKRQVCSYLPFLIQHCTESSSQCSKVRNRNKRLREKK